MAKGSGYQPKVEDHPPVAAPVADALGASPPTETATVTNAPLGATPVDGLERVLGFRTYTSDAAEEVSLRAERSRAWKEAFLKNGVLEIDSHGGVADYLKYARAVDAIRAKAATLGYGPGSEAVPILPVPGGYVGRFGGHDIYAAAQ